MSPAEFKRLGHALIDEISDFLATLRDRPITHDEQPAHVRALRGHGPVPEVGMDPAALLRETTDLLVEHSLFNGHPRFWGYITSSAAPIGALGDLLAAAVNPNVAGWGAAPAATAIEEQTVSWIAQLMGYPNDCGGLLVSGGNMANFVGFLTARKAKAPWDVRTAGVAAKDGRGLRVYASKETHTWIQKAADLSGLGTDAIHFLPTDGQQRLSPHTLRDAIAADLASGFLPFLVVGTAGTVSTGAVDPLSELAGVAREYGLWFHVDGAYGGLAAVLLDSDDGQAIPADLAGLREADSIAVDPHKWLYAPLEAGCALVRNKAALRDAFLFRPPYYHLTRGEDLDAGTNYFEYGPQNSRGFRALKVWLALRQVGRSGYQRMIADDIELATHLDRCVRQTPELQGFTRSLSITTFRYAPSDLQSGSVQVEAYLNRLNTEILDRLERSGIVFISNAVLNDRFLLRACVVNFRTTLEDVEALPRIVVDFGKQVDAELRSGANLALSE